MSKLAQRSAKAQENLEIIETALERTQQALRAAEVADLAATKVVRKSRKYFKLLLVLTVVGVVVLVAKKMLGGGAAPAPTMQPVTKPVSGSASARPADKGAATGSNGSAATNGKVADEAKQKDPNP